MAQKKEQWFIIAAASMFFVGAVFMFVNVLDGREWSLWTGLGFAAVSAVLYIIVHIARIRFNSKYSPRESEIFRAEQKTELSAAGTDNTSAPPVLQEAPPEPKRQTNKTKVNKPAKNNKKKK